MKSSKKRKSRLWTRSSIILGSLASLATIISIVISHSYSPAHIKNNDEVGKSQQTKTTEKEQDKPDSEKLSKITQIIKYKGSPISGAYFQVGKYKSTVSDLTGIVTCSLPLSMLEGTIEYDFYVYQDKALLYTKSMRFRNLNFDHNK